MKAALLTLIAAVALSVPGSAWADGISPDDRAYARATSPALNGSFSPDDRAASRATTLDTDWQPAPTIVRLSDRSFDWTDAGVGAASGFGIALILIGALLALRRGTVATA
jgi:hypothetical protein